MKRLAPLSWKKRWTGNEELRVVKVLPGLETLHQVCLWSSSIAPNPVFKFYEVIFYKCVAEVHSSGMPQLFASLSEHRSPPWLRGAASPYDMPGDVAASSADCNWREKGTRLAAAAALPCATGWCRGTAFYGHSRARSSAELSLLGCSIWAKSCKA